MNDAELVRHLALGDERALSAVWHRYAGQVRRTLRGCLGADEALDDLCQEVFLSLVRGAARMQEPARLRSYLVGTAIRQARHALRTRKRRRSWLALWARTEAETTHTSPVDPRDALRTLDSILADLSERHRESFVLRYVDGLMPSDVAEIRGVSLATAKRDIARARERVLLHAQRHPALKEYLTAAREEET
jgi:RNA polymerase sigma-70 factor (ECF subfamily)